MSTLKFNVEADWQEVQKLRGECERLEKQLSTMDDATKSSDLGKSVTNFYEQQKKALDGLTDSLVNGSVAFLKETQAMFGGATKGRKEVTDDVKAQLKELQPFEDELKTTATSMDELESRLGRVTSAMAENKNMVAQNKAVYDDLTRSYRDYEDIIKYAKASDNAALARQTEEWSLPAVGKELANWQEIQKALERVNDFLTQSEAKIRAQGEAMKEQVISFKTISKIEESRPLTESGNLSFGNTPAKIDQSERAELLKLTDELVAKGKEYKSLDPFSAESKQAVADFKALVAQYNEIMIQAKAYSEEVERQNKGLKSQLITAEDIENLEKGITANSKVNGVKLQFENQDDLDEANKVLSQLVEKGKEYQKIELDTPEGKALYKTLEGLKKQWDDLMDKAYQYSKMQLGTRYVGRKESGKSAESSADITNEVNSGIAGITKSFEGFSGEAKSLKDLNAQLKASAEAFLKIEELTDRNKYSLSNLTAEQTKQSVAWADLRQRQEEHNQAQEEFNKKGKISSQEMLDEAESLENEAKALKAEEEALQANMELTDKQISSLKANEEALQAASKQYDEFNEKIKQNSEALGLSEGFFEAQKKKIQEETEALDESTKSEGRRRQQTAGGATMYFDTGDYEEYKKLLDDIAQKEKEINDNHLDTSQGYGQELQGEIDSLRAQLSDVVDNALRLGRDMETAMKQAADASKETNDALGAMRAEVKEDTGDVKAMTEQFTQAKATGEELKEQLESISAALEKNKKASEENQQALKKLQTAQTQLKQAQSVASNSGDRRQTQDTSDQLKEIESEIKIREDLGKQLEENSEQLNSCKEQIEGYTESVEVSEQKHVSYQAQIRQMIMALAEMEAAGKRGTAEYIEMQNRLGELSAMMTGARAQMKAFAQPYPGLAATTGLIGDMSSAVKLGAGVWGLFNAETEEAQKILVKLQSVMSIANGLQEVANKLNKNNATSILLMSKGQERWNKLKSLFTKTQTVENANTAANTAAENANTAAKNANATSQQTKNAATATGTAETIGNTGADVANTAAAEGLTVANFTLAGAFKAVGTAILGIPAIGWIIGAIMGIGELVKYLSDYNEEQEKITKQAAEDGEKVRISYQGLADEWNRLATDEEKSGFLIRHQQDFDNLGESINDATDATKAFSKENIDLQTNLANAKSSYEQLQKAADDYQTKLAGEKAVGASWWKRMWSTPTVEKGTDKNGNETIHYNYFAEDEKELEEMAKKAKAAQDAVEALQNQLKGTENQQAADQDNKSAQRSLDAFAFTQEQDRINNMQDGFKKMLAQEKLDYKKSYQEIVSQVEELGGTVENGTVKSGGKLLDTRARLFQAQLDLLESQSKMSRMKIKEEMQKELDDAVAMVAKLSEDRAKMEKDLTDKEEQARIDAMADGLPKVLAQERLNHETRMAQIEEQHNERVAQLVKNEKEAFEAQERANAAQNPNYKKQEWTQEQEDEAKARAEEQVQPLTDSLKNIENSKYFEAVQKDIEKEFGDFSTLAERYQRIADEMENKKQELLNYYKNGDITFEQFNQKWEEFNVKKIKDQLTEFANMAGGDLSEFFFNYSSAMSDQIDEIISDLQDRILELDQIEVLSPEEIKLAQQLKDMLDKVIKAQDEANKKTEEGAMASEDASDAQDNMSKPEKLEAYAKAFGKLSNEIYDVANQIDDLCGGMDDTGKAAVNLINTLCDSAEQILSTFSQVAEDTTETTVAGLHAMESASVILAIIDAILAVVNAFVGLFSGKSSMELYEEEEAKAEQYMDTLDRVKDKRLEVADSASATTKETIDAYQDAIDITEKEIEAQRKLAKDYANARDKGSHTAGYTSYQNQTASSWQQAAGALNMDVGSLQSMMGGRMEGLYDLSWDQIDQLMKYAPEFLAELDSDMYDYLMTIYELGEECQDLAEDMQEAIAGISFDDMYENFRDVLSDMDSDMNDFTDTINDMLKNSISQYVMSKDEDLWKEWYEEYTQMVEDENWDAADALVDEAKNIYAREREEMDEITSSISSLSESSQGDATTAAFETMSEETASELSARFLALFEVGSRIETATQDDMNTRSVEMADLTSIAQLQVEQLIGLNSIADESRTFLADSFLELQSITENTEKIVENTKYIKQWTYDTKVNTSKL